MESFASSVGFARSEVSCRLDMHLGRITKLVKETLAVVPGQAESADVGYADPGYDIAPVFDSNSLSMIWSSAQSTSSSKGICWWRYAASRSATI